MIILPNQGLGFISITKCASTTIEAALSKHKGLFIGGTNGLKHTKFRHADRFIIPFLKAKNVERPHFFAITREPADRMMSWFKYRRRDELATAEEGSQLAKNYLGDMSFEEFAENAMNNPKKIKPRIDTQRSFLEDRDGKIGVDTTIRIEHVDDLLFDFLKRFNVNMPERVAKRRNISPTDKGEAMSQALRDRINTSEKFGPDMEIYLSSASRVEDFG